MKLPELNTIKDRQQAVTTAIDWQVWAGENTLYMSELAEANDYFTKLGKKFGLLTEFKENGVI